MTASTSLLDWILELLRDPSSRAAFQHDPDGYAAHHGFQGLSAADVHDALYLIADNGSASYDHRFGEHNDLHYPPPHHYESHDQHGHHESAAHYLNHYITNNYKVIDEHDTNIDNSVHQDVDTRGGDFHQHIDNDPVVASGDHAVAARGSIEHSTLTTGDDNVVGDHNYAVTGHDNTTAFGSGSASHADLDHVRTGDGGTVSLGGDATGHNTHSDTTTSVHSSGSGDTSVNAAGDHGYADQHADQSAHDDSTHTNYEDHSLSERHDQVASHNDTDYSDSHDYTQHA
jgi:hypothetical protein